MSEPIPVNPDILRWARETAGYSIEDVVDKIKRKRVTVKVVRDWENGNASPSYPQLEKLAYKIFKRPLALFFFPEPPEEETPGQYFRTLPRQEIDLIEPTIKEFQFVSEIEGCAKVTVSFKYCNCTIYTPLEKLIVNSVLKIRFPYITWKKITHSENE